MEDVQSKMKRRGSNLKEFDIFADNIISSHFDSSSDLHGSLSRFETVASDVVPHRKRSRGSIAVMKAEKISRVENSWRMIYDRIGEVGEKVFLGMFIEYPELIQLFPFRDDIDPVTGRLILTPLTKAHVQAHATAVMRVVGTCVAGLATMDDLIPRLRQVGATHRTAGVQAMHYDILYRHLVRAIREEVGPENWDQDTDDAWCQAFSSISDLIKSPSTRLETEPIRGWGIVVLVACAYFMLVTPFHFAGFLYGRPYAVALLNVLDSVAALVLAIDLCIDFIQSRIRVSKVSFNGASGSVLRRSAASFMMGKSTRNIIVKRRKSLLKRLQSLRMDSWVPWPSMDVQVLMSFPLQWMFVGSSICARVGLHWTQLFGLLRLVTASRVNHFLLCAENNALLNQKLTGDRHLHLNVAKLVFRLAFITHISACMWFIVARLQLGLHAEDFTPTAFFPSSELLSSDSNVFNAYSRAIHWAFVNLSGIGGVDSSPVSTLECWTTMIVHVIGAVFYAILTCNVIAILEEGFKRDNKIGTDIVRLSNFMTNARVSTATKDRIMMGYMMRNVLTNANEGKCQGGEQLDVHDAVLSTLPNYLRMEVEIYARAELMRQRDSFFTHCSRGFLVALSSSLSRTQTLLSGEYFMEQGKSYVPEFVFIERGSLQMRRNHHTLRTLTRGDCIGKAWLLQTDNEETNPQRCTERTDWLLHDGTAAISIRALSPCELLTGMSTKTDIERLKRGYYVDFQLLEAEARGTALIESERQAAAMRGIAKALRRFKSRRKAEQSTRSLESSADRKEKES